MFTTPQRQKHPKQILVQGQSGSGKTFTSLMLAAAYANWGDRVGLIDLGEYERSGSYYHLVPHDIYVVKTDTAGNVSMRDFLEALGVAIQHYDIIIVDTLSAMWTSLLSHKSTRDNQNPKNTFSNWDEVGRLWGTIIHTICNCPIPVIVCTRTKMEYVQEGRNIKPVGLAPIMRPNSEYEFEVRCTMDNGILSVEQPRARVGLEGLVIPQPTIKDLEVFWQ